LAGKHGLLLGNAVIEYIEGRLESTIDLRGALTGRHWPTTATAVATARFSTGALRSAAARAAGIGVATCIATFTATSLRTLGTSLRPSLST
jgi:hypothetical protein